VQQDQVKQYLQDKYKMTNKQKTLDAGHFAKSKTTNLSISTKHCVEISRFLRYKTTSFAKKYLQDVVDLKKAIPFKKFNRDTGHKVGGMAAGRYPQKAAKEFLKLVSSVESNAQVKGLNTSSLKISKLIANKASIPMTGGRHRSATKRTHLEIEVVETGKSKDKKIVTKKETKVDKKTQQKVEKKAEEKKVSPKVEEKNDPIEEKSKVESKEEIKPEVEIKQEETKVEEAQPETKEEIKQENSVPKENKLEVSPISEAKKEQEDSVKELSSEELLEKAQEAAAQLNKKEEQQKDVEDVSNLYEQLQKKGTLRDGEKQ